MTSLLGRLLPLFTGVTRVEDLFTEAVARLFERRPELCLSWLDELGLVAPADEGEQRHVRVNTQESFVPLEGHELGSRPDLILKIHRVSEDEETEGSTEIVMIESKIGSWEGLDQLKRYAGHLQGMYGDRKTLVYITRNYDPKDASGIETVASGIEFCQLRWHDFYRFLQTTEKDALTEEVMAFMEEQGMSRSHRFSTSDLMALSGVPRAFEIFDETLGDEVKAELEAFAGNRVKGQTQGLNNIRWHWRYIIIASLHDWDLICFIGYAMDDPEEPPGLIVNLESRPNAMGREVSVAAMKRISAREEWEEYNLNSPSNWAGICRWMSLIDVFSEEDHVAAVKRFFIESIGQLREELTEFKKENPELPWIGGVAG